MAFLKTVLIIIMVYYLFKILARLFAPKIINYAAKKTEAHFKEQFGQFNQQPRSQGEERVGDVIIEKKPTKKGTDSEKHGDYIDFEEID